MKPLLLLLPLAALALTACTSTPPAPRYTIFPTTEAVPQVTMPGASLRLRMAEDLRAYNAPLHFHADGTVTTFRALRYYAPLELALERALADLTTFQSTANGTLNVEVRDYCLVDTADGMEARVTLVLMPSGQTPIRRSAVQPLPATATTAEVREAFAAALREAYRN